MKDKAVVTMAVVMERLTRREGQVLELLVEGLRNREIASELGLSPITVKGYVSHILEKLGCRNRVELTRWWLENQEKMGG